MDTNLKLALIAAMYDEKILKGRLDGEVARKPAAKPLRADQLARVKHLQWPDPDGTLVLDLDDGYTPGVDDVFDIADLSGLEACKKLEVCILNALAPGVDLSPLAKLPKLTELVASATSLAPLATLTRLERLEVDGPIADLSPLAKLTKLEVLSLRASTARDLSPLANLGRLESLTLDMTRATDLTVLRSLPKLKSVQLRTHAGKHRAHVQTIANELVSRGVELIDCQVGDTSIKPSLKRKTARNAKLEAAIVADRDAEAPYRAYAKWLGEGDPLGELIDIDLRMAKRATPALKETRRVHLVRHQAQLTGGLEAGSWEWRYGFVRSLGTVMDIANLKPLALPTAIVVDRLSLAIMPSQTKLVDALAKAKPRPPLRELAVRTIDGARVSVASVLGTYRELRRVELEGDIAIGAKEVPEVVELEMRGHDDAVGAVMTARWPKLELLDIEICEESFAERLDPARLPKLSRVRVTLANQNWACATLVASKLLPQLRHLELCGEYGVDERGEVLVDNATRFAHLDTFTFDIAATGKLKKQLLALQR